MLTICCIGTAHSARKLTAESAQIVDCLLPGKVKKLGMQRSYLSKKRPIKTSTNDCEIRGGEYTAYDRASLASALKIWQGDAILGNAEAQFYVGEIFEKGAGEAPNYKQAINWYQQAADQDYAPAMMGLGRMYEAGLGVPKDLAKAMNLYRRASGLKDDEIGFASVFHETREQDLIKISSLESDLSQERANSKALQTQLNNLQNSLDKKQSNVRDIQGEIQKSKREYDSLQVKLGGASAASLAAMEAQLSDAQAQLQAKTQLADRLNRELNAVSEGKDSERYLEEELIVAKSGLAEQRQANSQKEQQISLLKSQLIELTNKDLDSAELNKKLQSVRQQSLAEKTLLKRNLAALESDLKLQQAKVQSLKVELVTQRSSVADNSSNIAKQSKQLAEKEAQIAEQNNKLANTAEELIAKNQELADKNQKLENDKSKLANQQQSIQSADQNAQSQLLVAEQKLIADQQARKAMADKIQRLEGDLELLSKTSKMGAASKDQVEANLRALLDSKELAYQKELNDLQGSLKEKTGLVTLLESRVSALQASGNDQEAYIASLKAQFADANKGLLASSESVESKNTELADAQQKIVALETEIANRPTVLQLKSLEESITLKESALAAAELEKQQLNETIAQVKAEKLKAENKLNEAVPQGAPVIAIRWPKPKDDDPSKAEAPAGSQISVVGAVYPPQGISKFTINGKPEELDANGLFLASMEMGNSKLELSFSAEDDQGKITNKALTIIPNATSQLLAGSGLSNPKVKYGKYHALVFGNNGYNDSAGWPALQTAVNDAQSMSELLKDKYGFKVTTVLDASRDEMLLALEAMRKKLTEKDNLLIYYAGHGYMDPENDQGYWIPVNATASSTLNWVSNATITDQIRAMTARNVMVIADSCYSASLMRSGIVNLRSGLTKEKRNQRLQEDVRAVTRMALSSGGLQPVADAIDDSGHSVFANAIMNSLKKNNSVLDGDSLATEVGLNVSVATRKHVKQVPRYAPLSKGGHQGGEFYFVPRS